MTTDLICKILKLNKNYQITITTQPSLLGKLFCNPVCTADVYIMHILYLHLRCIYFQHQLRTQ